MPDSVLVVEDDDRIRTMLRMALEDEGYEVREAASGEDGVARMQSAPADFAIIDLMLGGMDGFSCIRQIRRRSDVPIIIVSARTDTHDIVAGLEAGADDYVTKPFQIKEITARLRALGRRLRPRESVPGSAVTLSASDPRGALVLRPAEGRLLRGEDEVHLTLTEFRLLCELAEAQGQVLSRRQLLERVWDEGFFGDERLVDVHVRRLRTKVESDPGNPQIVVTVRGLGYRLEISPGGVSP
jgi:DNA-binding response OmpR family regulator